MRSRDPLTLALIATAVYAGLVAMIAFSTMGETAEDLAASIPANDRPDVAVGAPADGASVSFEVEFGEPGDTIADRLVEAGIIADAERFRVLLDLTGGASNIQAGRYELAPSMPASEVLHRMLTGAVAADLVTIPEGLRLEEVGAILEGEGLISLFEWERALLDLPDSPLLLGLPPDASLLGYLFPASYPFLPDDPAEEMIAQMLTALEIALEEEGLLDELVASGLTLHETLTLASIVEREAVIKEEQPIVASVFRNRLEAGIALQADPTVQFAIADRDGGVLGSLGEAWWKRELTVDDLDYNSLYNTYLYPGLPPGPIANPGIDAIRAAILPADTPYLYFVAVGDDTGAHAFAETLDEHNENVERYRARGEE